MAEVGLGLVMTKFYELWENSFVMSDYSFVFPDARNAIFTQSYAQPTQIEGVKLIPIKSFVADEGDFSEILRFDDNGDFEHLPGFKVRQVNRTRLFGGSIKAWHVHEFQDEVWYVPPTFHLVGGLWDVRTNSPTAGATMKFVLGGGNSSLLVVPRGVAHGTVNFSGQPAELFYFVNQRFNRENPDEHRIHWDHLGADFWKPERD